MAANTTSLSPTEKHLSLTVPSYDPTIDQSMAEAFVSMHLNMTQVIPLLKDFPSYKKRTEIRIVTPTKCSDDFLIFML